MSDTPITDELRDKIPDPRAVAEMIASHADLERELAEVTKQRDALAEAGRMCLDTMNTSSISRMLPAKNAMTAALAAVKGGKA